MLKKNTAGQFIYFALVNASDGSAHTGQTPTGYVSIDAAGQAGIGGSIAELANGQYKIVLSQGDTNGDELGYFVTNSGSIPVSITVTTETKKMADLNDIAAGADMNLADDAITSDKYDESTAYALESADTGSSQVARVGADGDTLEALSDEIAALPDAAAINAQVDTALADIHLDHLLGVDFDSASPVGNATSFLRQMVENDSGTLRYTTNSLEQAPSGTGGDATEAKQDEILVDLVDIKGTSFIKDTHSLVDHALNADVLSASDIKSECDDALSDIYLDQLIALAYNSASPAGSGASLFNELTENDAGATRFTANALEEAPSGTGGDASEANQTLLLEDIADLKGSGFVKDTDSMVDLAHIGADADTLEDLSDEIAAVASALSTVDDEIEIMATDIDNILIDTSSTLDNKLDAILVDTGTTLDGKMDDIDTVVDFIQDILEGDHVVDDGETPYEYLIKEKGTENVLVTKEMYEIDDTNITGVNQVVSKLIEP